jgi:AP-3 complex subunit mu
MKICKWTIGKLPKDKTPMLTGTVSLTPGSGAPDSSPTVLVDFKIQMFAVSGIKVESLVLHNEKYKVSYKGVRSVTRAGKFQVRSS